MFYLQGQKVIYEIAESLTGNYGNMTFRRHHHLHQLLFVVVPEFLDCGDLRLHRVNRLKNLKEGI